MNENIPLVKYKDRLLNGAVLPVDIFYSFENYLDATTAYSREEMTMRSDNNGFCEMPMWHEDSAYDPYMDVSDYHEKQPDVADDDKLELEDDILKYVDRIIELCEEKGVTLIFYRAPYVSSVNELRKTNWFADYCEERGVKFVDLEKEIDFDITTDFLDYHHLNKNGALKATDYLAPLILDAVSTN